MSIERQLSEISVQKLVLEGVLVPYAVRVEHKNLFALHIAEDQILVEHVYCPEHFAGDQIGIDLLQVLNVDYDSADISEVVALVEHNLLSVRQELSMESEVVQDCHLSGEGKRGHNKRDQDELRHS